MSNVDGEVTLDVKDVSAVSGGTSVIKVTLNGEGDGVSAYNVSLSFDFDVVEAVDQTDFISDTNAFIGTKAASAEQDALVVNGAEATNQGDSFFWEFAVNVVGSGGDSTAIDLIDSEVSASSDQGEKYDLVLDDGQFDVLTRTNIELASVDTDSGSTELSRTRKTISESNDTVAPIASDLSRTRSSNVVGVDKANSVYAIEARINPESADLGSTGAYPVNRERILSVDGSQSDSSLVGLANQLSPIATDVDSSEQTVVVPIRSDVIDSGISSYPIDRDRSIDTLSIGVDSGVSELLIGLVELEFDSLESDSTRILGLERDRSVGTSSVDNARTQLGLFGSANIAIDSFDRESSYDIIKAPYSLTVRADDVDGDPGKLLRDRSVVSQRSDGSEFGAASLSTDRSEIELLAFDSLLTSSEERDLSSD
jgi:hypothetical protein